ncbi:hypothetical protein FRC20_002989 [Serendipita sp. 405]|nr:hypothetical protein FRC20_002989 [Serendipita sp. 405]
MVAAFGDCNDVAGGGGDGEEDVGMGEDSPPFVVVVVVVVIAADVVVEGGDVLGEGPLPGGGVFVFVRELSIVDIVFQVVQIFRLSGLRRWVVERFKDAAAT